ncbi:ubiquitin-conjugating enzyme E2 T [Amyelois transitella]|uniref:ubiquitin-conjugating enzyme E2 T n=1 Tax=Amyelois transitella TaxID=680683 RepID=UPI00298FDF62|nr:ubiquitin-conjugating enzyme E2 T [Amyelois transitella]
MASVPAARSARLAREILNFETRPPWGISCVPAEKDNFDVLIATLNGPRNTPYENGKFKVRITIPDMYPYEPPLVKFATPVYHPNIDRGGRICMDMLKMPPRGAWVPTITLETLLVSLQTLLANPNPNDPLMMDVANEYKQDRDQFMLNAKLYTEKYAV